MKKWFHRGASARAVGLVVAGFLVVTIGIFVVHRHRTEQDPGAAAEVGEVPSPPTADMVFIDTDAGGYYIDPYEFPNRAGMKPETIPTIQDAREACAREGKRLCTDAEWRRACLGASGRNTYGYPGSQLVPGRCNGGKRLSSGHSGMVDPDGYRQEVTPSGSLEECRTEEGVYDLVGNMEEWVLSSWQGLGGNLEGGAWFTVPEYAACSGAYSRQPHFIIELERPLFTAGARCCWSAEAPTEEDLSAEALAADTVNRLNAAKALASTRAYDPDNEVPVSPGIWIDRFEYPNRAGEVPRIGLSWVEARQLCEAADKRLCSVGEWEAACAGEGRLRYPYGHELRSGACPLLLDAPAPSGSFEACRSPSGAMDMGGGVWEWTSNRLTQPGGVYHGDVILREVRGASWMSVENDSACRPEHGFPAASQDARFPDVGFRCCRGDAAVVPPAAAQVETIRCPASMVAIGDFCIDRYEYPNEAGKTPLGNQSFADAVRLCRARGVHLCGELEWMAACAGPTRRRWPYGEEYVAGTCRHGQTPTKAPSPIAASGEKQGCRTPEGVYDLSGNLWEWTVGVRGEGTLRGGGPSFNALFGQCEATAVPEPSYNAFDTGSRCCATREEVAGLTRKDAERP